MHRKVGTMLDYHAYDIIFKVVSLLSAELHVVVIGLFFCSYQSVVAGFYYYNYCLSDNQRWQCTKVEEAGGSYVIGLVYWQTILHSAKCMYPG